MGSYDERMGFDKPIQQLEAEIRGLEQSADADPESLRKLRKRLLKLKREVYTHLSPWETVQVSRHPNRPQTSDYIQLLFDDFVELHGDRCFGDDQAIITGFAKLSDYRLLFLGQQKGKSLNEKKECFFGCPHPEGYRKALAKMKLAEKFGLPIVTFIDTPGAYPGIGSEERGMAMAIAVNLMEMARLRTPIISVVIGEGGSGGALGIGIGDRVSMLEHSWYSVISPEGCAGILWKNSTPENSQRAAESLRITSGDLLKFDVIDEIIPEPPGGAHRDHRETAKTVKAHLLKHLRAMCGLDPETIVTDRYTRFRRLGRFLDGNDEAGAMHSELGSPEQPDRGTAGSEPVPA